VSSHRRRRSASLTHSELDSIPGVGSSRKKTLLENFDSIDKIRISSVEELSSLDGISENLARKILGHLNK
jgi:excinuclease ABC subunit C